MLYVSFLPTACLLALAHAAANRPPVSRALLYLAPGFLVTFGTVFVMFLSPAAVCVYVALAVALLAWSVGRRRFWPYSAAAVAVGYLVVFFWLVRPDLAEYAQLRRDYPFESLAGRLPEPRRAEHPPTDPAALAELDERARRELGWQDRDLRALHEDATELFVNAQGFGATRMRPGPSRHGIEYDGHGPTPRQPHVGSPEPVPAGEARDAGPLRRLHADAVFDFVNPGGWGYVKDRTRVAGFRPHRFSRVPDGRPPWGETGAKPAWEVETIELVGLLLRPEPVVYVSDKLPAMDRLREIGTRPPDGFEAAGLAVLRAGKDHYAAAAGDRLRLVGSLRNGQTCQTCHGGEVGDLLGALSYTLRPDPPYTIRRHVRNGLVRFSYPTVVTGPCPG